MRNSINNILLERHRHRQRSRFYFSFQEDRQTSIHQAWAHGSGKHHSEGFWGSINREKTSWFLVSEPDGKVKEKPLRLLLKTRVFITHFAFQKTPIYQDIISIQQLKHSRFFITACSNIYFQNGITKNRCSRAAFTHYQLCRKYRRDERNRCNQQHC